MTVETFHCPFCDGHSTLNEDSRLAFRKNIALINVDGPIEFIVDVKVCNNSKCRKLSLSASTLNLVQTSDGRFVTDMKHPNFRQWNLIPTSRQKVLPNYIPEFLVRDYVEACAIVDLSPKASATLARRCLQGMIRDFHGINKGRLIDEINALKGVVDDAVWEAINGLKSIGNIGAHPEKDVNLIIDIEPEEASELILLIENLFEEWYINRQKRKDNFNKVKTISDQKAQQKKPQGSPQSQ